MGESDERAVSQTVETKIGDINDVGEREIEMIEDELEGTELDIARDPPQESGPILIAPIEVTDLE